MSRNPPKDKFWNEERLAEVKRRIDQGETGLTIAKFMGKSRAAICSVAAQRGWRFKSGMSGRYTRKPEDVRLGLGHTPPPVKPRIRVKKTETRGQRPKLPKPLPGAGLRFGNGIGNHGQTKPPRPIVLDTQKGTKTLAQSGAKDCRWPFQVEDEWTICGEAATRGAYCEHHGAISYGPRKEQANG